MNTLVQSILNLLDALERDGDFEGARTTYRETVQPLIGKELPDSLEVALVELKEMLFVHPNFSNPARDIRTSIGIIRDELEDKGSSSSS